MSSDRYFKLSSYLLTASGFIAVAAGGGAGTTAQALFACVLVGSWFVDTARLGTAVPRRALNALVPAYLFFYAADLRYLSGSFITSTIRLLFFLAAVKLLTRTSDRDWICLYLISFAELLVASTLSVNITFALTLLLFLFSGVSTLVVLEMRMSNARAQRQGRIDPLIETTRDSACGLQLFGRFPAGRMVALSGTMAATILILVIPLFLALPRVSLGVRNRPHGRTRLLSGFSERVELGRIGTIRESDAVVMKIRASEPVSKLPPTLKWRGIALEDYDGRAWNRSSISRVSVPDSGGYFRLAGTSQGTEILWQTCFLEALSTDVLFAAGRVLAVSGDLEYLQRDGAGALYAAPHLLRKLRYTAISDISPVTPDLIPLEQGNIPAAVRESCLRVPSLDPRIAELAKRVTELETHPFEKARDLERHLRESYRYGLELGGRVDNSDPLAAFLFETRTGHCEYFATAMAVMLRQIGIPSRLVNGFRIGEYNALGDAWVVREYDAHSWVEAYFTPYGWIEFDPTPVAPRKDRSALMRWSAGIAEAMDIWWWEGVVAYDIWKQSRLAGSILSGLQDTQAAVRENFLLAVRTSAGIMAAIYWPPDPAIRGLAVALGVIVTAVALYLALRRPYWARKLLRRLGRTLHAGNRQAVVLSFYGEALELLAAHGLERPRSQTPLEFVRCLAGHPACDAFLALTLLYNRARFGASSDPEDGARAEATLTSLRLALRGKALGPR